MHLRPQPNKNQRHRQKTPQTIAHNRAAQPTKPLPALQNPAKHRQPKMRQHRAKRHPKPPGVLQLQPLQNPLLPQPNQRRRRRPNPREQSKNAHCIPRQTPLSHLVPNRRRFMRKNRLQPQRRNHRKIYNHNHRVKMTIISLAKPRRRNQMHGKHEQTRQSRRRHHPRPLPKKTHLPAFFAPFKSTRVTTTSSFAPARFAAAEKNNPFQSPIP